MRSHATILAVCPVRIPPRALHASTAVATSEAPIPPFLPPSLPSICGHCTLHTTGVRAIAVAFGEPARLPTSLLFSLLRRGLYASGEGGNWWWAGCRGELSMGGSEVLGAGDKVGGGQIPCTW